MDIPRSQINDLNKGKEIEINDFSYSQNEMTKFNSPVGPIDYPGYSAELKLKRDNHSKCNYVGFLTMHRYAQVSQTNIKANLQITKFGQFTMTKDEIKKLKSLKDAEDKRFKTTKQKIEHFNNTILELQGKIDSMNKDLQNEYTEFDQKQLDTLRFKSNFINNFHENNK